jgi:hypothetical protein
VARPARAVRPLGLGLEAVRSLECQGGLEASLRGAAGPRPGVDHPRQHRGPGAPARRRGGQKGGADQALGRSRGGFGTKIHIVVDALGNPVEFVLTAGQEADVTQAEGLIEGHEAGAVIADKAFDSDALVRAVERRGAEAVIPPKKNRKVLRTCDKHVYKQWFA